MSNLNDLDWSQLLRVSNTRLNELLILKKETQVRDNLKIRFYGFHGDQNGLSRNEFIQYMLSEVEGYVFDREEIDELIADGVDPFKSALEYWGKVNPITDGRYGELLLYILTEGILGVPLVVHKISQSYSPKKQVEGSDGIFLGKRNNQLSLLLGESKMRNQFSICMSDAIGSIDRFNGETDALKHEIKVARKHLSKDITNLDHNALENLYNSFKVGNEVFDQFSVSHPILLVYKEKDIANVTSNIEEEITKLILSKSESREKSINNNSTHYEEGTILDFFLLPVSNVSDFRNDLFEAFYGEKYVSED